MTPSADTLLAVIEMQNAIAAAGLNADEVMRLVAERAAALTGGARSAVLVMEGSELVVRAVAGGTKGAGPAVGARTTTEPGSTDPSSADGTLLSVPLLYGETSVGVLEVKSAGPHTFVAEDAATLRLLAQVVAIALHRAYTYPRPRQDTQHDALTGIGNRRAFDERIQAELTRHKRYGHSFSLSLLDLAGLETSADRLGQIADDETLREVARILQQQTRAIDACFRIGPDDFAVLMPGTSLAGAHIVAERCRTRIVEAHLCAGGIVPTFGVVEAATESADELATRARAALATDRQTQRA